MYGIIHNEVFHRISKVVAHTVLQHMLDTIIKEAGKKLQLPISHCLPFPGSLLLFCACFSSDSVSSAFIFSFACMQSKPFHPDSAFANAIKPYQNPAHFFPIHFIFLGGSWNFHLSNALMTQSEWKIIHYLIPLIFFLRVPLLALLLPFIIKSFIICKSDLTFFFARRFCLRLHIARGWEKEGGETAYEL